MWQTVNMTNEIGASLIDNQTVWFNFSAWIGGFGHQNDSAQASLIFIDQSNHQVGITVTMGPILATDRDNRSALLFQQSGGVVPIGARLFRVTVTMLRTDGINNNGCIDNIAVLFHQ